MLYIFLNPFFLSLVLISILLLGVGIIAMAELYSAIFPVSVTPVSVRVMESLYRFVVLVMIIFCEVAILRQLTGGGTNAL